MAIITKTIGKLPVFKGEWVAGTYSMLNQVTLFGSTFQSKIDNNTSKPAEIVAGKLVVNPNWIVTSNGTAAYLADERITAVENKTVVLDEEIAQLERDVNVLRSDVQGVSFENEITTATKINLTKAFTLSAYLTITDVASPTNPEPIIAQATNMYDAPFNGLAIYRYSNNLLRVKYGMGSNAVFYSIDAAIYHNKPIKIDITFDGATTANIYLNAQLVKTSSTISTTGIADVPIVMNKGIIRQLRITNTALTQQQIETLYNQGRCDEVVLDDKWKQNKKADNTATYALNNPALGTLERKSDKANGFVGDYYRMVSTVNDFCFMFSNAVANAIGKTKYAEFKIRYRASVELRFGDNNANIRIPINTDNAIEYILIADVSAINPGNQYPFYIYGKDNWCEIEIISVKTVDLINEYLPSFLTQTRWIDTGINKQDIALKAPTFSYVKPYKQFNYGSGAPSTPPVAAFVEYTDVDTGRVWKSGGKPNTRQFDLNDYGIIKQGRS